MPHKKELADVVPGLFSPYHHPPKWSGKKPALDLSHQAPLENLLESERSLWWDCELLGYTIPIFINFKFTTIPQEHDGVGNPLNSKTLWKVSPGKWLFNLLGRFLLPSGRSSGQMMMHPLPLIMHLWFRLNFYSFSLGQNVSPHLKFNIMYKS